jgi:hypothetical protein
MTGASEAEVLLQLDRLTEPYGGLGAYGRADQPSHKFVANELQELRGMALVVPVIFLAVSSFLLKNSDWYYEGFAMRLLRLSRPAPKHLGAG